MQKQWEFPLSSIIKNQWNASLWILHILKHINFFLLSCVCRRQTVGKKNAGPSPEGKIVTWGLQESSRIPFCVKCSTGLFLLFWHVLQTCIVFCLLLMLHNCLMCTLLKNIFNYSLSDAPSKGVAAAGNGKSQITCWKTHMGNSLQKSQWVYSSNCCLHLGRGVLPVDVFWVRWWYSISLCMWRLCLILVVLFLSSLQCCMFFLRIWPIITIFWGITILINSCSLVKKSLLPTRIVGLS